MYDVYISTEYEELAEKVIDEHPDLRWIRATGVSIGYLESDQEKKNASGYVLGQCSVVKDIYRPYCHHDFLITIFLPNTAHLSEEQKKVLLYHELLHVDVDESSGEPKYRTAPHDVEEFRSVIDQYGIDWAGR